MPEPNQTAASVDIPQPVAPPNTDVAGQPATPPPAPQMTPDQRMIAQGAAQTAAGAKSPLIGTTNLSIPTLAPQAPQAQASQPAGTIPSNPQDRPQDKAGWFNHFLKAMTPPQNVVTTNDDGTQTVKDVRTGTSMASLLLSGALAGMMTKPSYREGGAYGPVYDSRATATDAYQAGAKVGKDWANAPQAQADDMQKRKVDAQTKMLQVAKSNIDNMQLYAAYNKGQKADFGAAASSYAPMLALGKAHDDNLANPDDPKAILQTGVPMTELIKHPDFQQKMLQHAFVPDGQIDVFDPATNKMVPRQTFAIINPDVTLSLDKDTADMASKINPQIGQAFDASKGDIKLRLQNILDMSNTIGSVKYAEGVFKNAAKSDDPAIQSLGMDKNVEADILSAVKQGAPNFVAARKALLAMEHAQAAGGTLADALNRLVGPQADPEARAGAGTILNALGIDPENAAAYVRSEYNERTRQAKLAGEGGMGGKAPADPAKIQGLSALADKNGLTPAQKADVLARVPTTVDEYDAVVKAIQDANKENVNRLAEHPEMEGSEALTIPKGFAGNPNVAELTSADLQKDLQSKGVNLPANFEALYAVAHNAADLKTLPTRVTKGTNQMDAQTGLGFIRTYINPQYQEGDYKDAADLSREIASTRQGTSGGSLLAAGTASNHLELLDRAAEALNNRDTLALNRIANVVGVQLGKSSAVTFRAIADQVNSEVGKVMSGGGATHQAELDKLQNNLNTDQSPEQVHRVIRSYVDLMAGRVNEINDRSQQYFGRDVKGISPATARVFAKYGADVPGYVRVQMPNGVVGAIPKSQVDAFKKKYPNATIGGQ